jgi:ADP-heptose:LPS heptosyltransferase
VDELKAYPQASAAWGDMVAMLAEGPAPRPYRPEDWPAPICAVFDSPRGDYCVLHVGAGSRLRLWNRDRWFALADALSRRGLQVVWSAGRGEESEVAEIDPARRFVSCAGTLDLAQLWHLVKGARLLVCPDTGIAHLGRVTGTPTVALYGPGSAVLFGRGAFWRDGPSREVTVDPFPCRDQRTLFKRELAWVRRCQRTLAECAEPRCMHAIGVEAVLAEAATLLRR